MEISWFSYKNHMMYVLQGRGILTMDTKLGKLVVVAVFVHIFPCHRFTPGYLNMSDIRSNIPHACAFATLH